MLRRRSTTLFEIGRYPRIRITMKIVLEIGTEKQRQLIADEFGIIGEICKDLSNPPPICGIWVPDNFAKTVNELQGTNNYIAERRHVAIAKNFYVGNEIALVFSRELYTDNHDNHTRMQIILHEFCHAINKIAFPSPPNDSLANLEYLQNLYILFDEYWANRWSFELTERIYPSISERYKRLTRCSVVGFLRDIVQSENDYQYIKMEIRKFRFHNNVDLFLENTRENFDIIAKSLVYFFSLVHHNPKYSRVLKFLSSSRFVGESALALVEFFREKYEQRQVEISEGLVYLQNFMERFGVRFEDRGSRFYCTIIDI